MNKIFGYDFKDIQDMQQGNYKPKLINMNKGKPKATIEDIELLESIGIDGIKENGFFGVIDRLNTSGLINGVK